MRFAEAPDGPFLAESKPDTFPPLVSLPRLPNADTRREVGMLLLYSSIRSDGGWVIVWIDNRNDRTGAFKMLRERGV